MGLVAAASPGLQSTISSLTPGIMAALQRAAGECAAGRAGTVCQRWFGDNSVAFQSQLAVKLRRFRSVINLQHIDVRFAPLADRNSNENAAAYEPNGGWQSYLGTSQSQGQGFTMHLNEAFAQLPIYAQPNPATTDGQSQFETLVHELSHLVLGTDDEIVGSNKAYGGQLARLLVTIDVAKAKNNAENWGLFVEEFRA
jgi:hypothetical protein